MMTNSHILVGRFDYFEPVSVDEAVALLTKYGKRAKLLAGGTDLFVHMKMERIAPEAVISIGRISGLDRIALQDGKIHIGALATIRSIEMDPCVAAHLPALTDACASFSTTQIQTMGTVGGNLGNGSPAADTAPSLIAFGALAEITGPRGKRCLPLEEFFAGPGRTVLQEGELLTDVVVPLPQSGTGSAFCKIARVAADIAKASAAVTLVRDGRRVVDCRMVFGSVAPVPMRAREAERTLIGKMFSQELVNQAAQQAADEVKPIDDVRSEAWYRREAVRALACDGLSRAWQRTEAGHSEGARSSATRADRMVPSSLPQNARVGRLEAGERRWIELNVNGRNHRVWVGATDLLMNVLRDQLQLTGTKYGCGIGECSACTVQVDGKPALACLMLAISATGREIVTVEGLQKPNGELDRLQEAFVDFAAYQCGYCTPGMLLTARSLLAEKPDPSEEDVRHYMRGNLCRCTGYAAIVRAVLSCATESLTTESTENTEKNI